MEREREEEREREIDVSRRVLCDRTNGEAGVRVASVARLAAVSVPGLMASA